MESLGVDIDLNNGLSMGKFSVWNQFKQNFFFKLNIK